MRFRLATSGAGGGGQDLAGGVGNLFRSVAMAPALAAQAQQEAMDAQAQRDLRAAQTRTAEAQALLYGEQARDAVEQRDRSSLGAVLRNAALMNNVNPKDQPDLVSFLQTGQMPGQYTPAPDGSGPVLPVPALFTDGTAQRVARTAGIANQALAQGDKNVENLAKAEKLYRDLGLGDQIIAGTADPTRVAQARFATTGGPAPFEFKEFGTGNQVTGGLDESTGAAIRFGQVRQSEIRENNAQANSANASAAKARADIDREARSGDLAVVTGPDGTVNVVNKRDRTAQMVTGPNGQPLVKGSAGGANKTMTEGQAKANIFGFRMTDANKIIDELADQGVTTVSQIKRVADSVPLIGPGLGAIANSAFASPGEQRLEQAQRDFINAVLRRESGAVIADSEFANAAQQYFPQPGDSPQVIQQKRANRQRAAQLLLMEVPVSVRAESQVPPAAPAVPQRQSGATVSWDSPAPPGWSIQRVEN